MLLWIVCIFLVVTIVLVRRKREGFEDLQSFTGLLFFIKPEGCNECAKMKEAYTRLALDYPDNVRIIDCTQNLAATCTADNCVDSNAATSYMTIYRVDKNQLPVIVALDTGKAEKYYGGTTFVILRAALIELMSHKKSVEEFKRTSSFVS